MVRMELHGVPLCVFFLGFGDWFVLCYFLFLLFIYFSFLIFFVEVF